MTRSIRLIFLCFLTLIFSASGFSGGSCMAAGNQSETSRDPESIEHMMAGLSDVQVRQLLIDELRKSAESEDLSSDQQMKGPAFVLSRLLTRLSRGQDDNRSQVATLFSFIPSMGPDLYKVFVKL